jgi:hypothetical protein
VAINKETKEMRKIIEEEKDKDYDMMEYYKE